ncbi:MAG TPA: Maf family protein [Polyangiaceae bacterium]|jgi:septum formation protein
MSEEKPLVLGSGSPRRREMLAMVGIPFVVRTADVDETRREGEGAREYLERVTAAKLEGVRAGSGREDRGTAMATATGGERVLVADTIVVAPGGEILGKPVDDADALRMIRALAGATHEVRTRFLLAEGAGAPVHAETVTTRVRMRAVSPDEAAGYVATGEGKDKAGAYGVQGRAAAFIDRIEGSYTCVVGLPLSEVVAAMHSLGWW